LVHVVAEFMAAGELLPTGVTAYTTTIVAYVVAPQHDKGLRCLPRTLVCAEGHDINIGVKYIPNTPAAIPPPPPGPPPSQGQVVGVANAPASMEAGGTFVAPAVQGTDTVMTDATLATAPVIDVPAPEDPVQIAADMVAQREESCYSWLEDNSDVVLSGGIVQTATSEQLHRAIQRVRQEHAHVFNAPEFTGTTPHSELQALLTATLQEVFDNEGFTSPSAPQSQAPLPGPPTQSTTTQAQGPRRGPNKGNKGPSKPQRARSTSPTHTASVAAAHAPAQASTSQQARVAPAARGRGLVPASPRPAKGRVQGTQAAAAGPTGHVRRPAHRSLSPTRSSRTTSEAAVVTTRSGRVSHPVSGVPHWSSRGPTA
jgi:hypothetical protein